MNRTNLNLRITLVVFCAFVISFFTLFIVQYEIWNEFFIDVEDELFTQTLNQIHSQESDPLQKRIFIFGSSQSKQLIVTHIQTTISKEKKNYFVYNLAIGGDTPKERLRIIDTILDTNPDFVFYGVSFRDFQSITRVEESEVTKPDSPFPDPQEHFETLFVHFEKNSGQDFDFLQSAQLTTLRAIREVISEEDRPQLIEPIHRNPIIMTEEELNNPRWVSQASGKIQPLHMNKQYAALREIIEILQDKEVKIVLFTTPHSTIYLNAVPERNQDLFNEIFKNVSEEFNVRTYFLHDKYKQLDIWSDASHVAFNQSSIIFSDDVAKIILEEIN